MSFQRLLRLILFIVIYLILLNFFASPHQKLTIPLPKLPSLSQLLPAKSQEKINEFQKNPFFRSLADFPQKQIKDFQIWLIKSISTELIKNIQN